MRSALLVLAFIFIGKNIHAQAIANVPDSLALVQLYDSTDGPHWNNHANWKTGQPLSSWFGISGRTSCTTTCTFYVTSIALAGNNLSGIIPSSIGNISRLNMLELDSNNLVGTIPSAFGSLRSLNKLNLSHNQLSGSIPATITGLYLFYLDLSANRLSGYIPPELGIQYGMGYFDVSENQLTGPIPSTFYNHDTLAQGTFKVKNNRLTFAGMETIAQQYTHSEYAPQGTIHITQQNNHLYVSPGGTLSHDTLRWYRNNVLDTGIVGDTTLTIHSLGKYSVTVTNSIATKLTLFSDTIDVTSLGVQAAPTINNFTPKSGITGTLVTITGKGFANTTAVSFGGTPATTFNQISDTVILATVGSGSSGTVSVTTPNGTSVLSGFVFLLPPPSVNSFSPTSGNAGTTIIIKGSHFGGITSVSFGGTTATSFSVINDSTVSAIVGAGATGSLIVTSPNGADTVGGFTFIPAAQPVPLIYHFEPSSGDIGTNVIITGKNFIDANSVTFGGTQASSFIVTTDTTIQAIVGPGATGPVTVTNGYGTATGAVFVFAGQPAFHRFALIQFNVLLNGLLAELQWQTRNEQNISSYEIERSGDSTLFSAIGTFQAKNDSGINNYFFTDSLPLYSTNYYRLKIINQSGAYMYSNIISVRLPEATGQIRVYPNPANGFVVVEHPSVNTNSQIKLIDLTGRIIQTVQVGPNTAQTRLDIANVPHGIYKISWTDSVDSFSQTLLIQ
ncbi:MAG: IPT/TIG domain-containing protein [Bacteroidetes bacterium]|nr:IPT/TIG domain-containing protein [Bacteroidota bacterium]